jgi:enolase-phosphatase E1
VNLEFVFLRKIWEEGYALRELHGQVYADVPPAFSRWRLQKREICIYSSGSVLAQQLLFRSTSGAKTETYSYRKIAEALTHNPHDLLFISDAVKEVRAASDAGMQAIICDRDVQAPKSEEAKTVIYSFDEVFPG